MIDSLICSQEVDILTCPWLGPGDYLVGKYGLSGVTQIVFIGYGVDAQIVLLRQRVPDLSVVRLSDANTDVTCAAVTADFELTVTINDADPCSVCLKGCQQFNQLDSNFYVV